MTAMTKEDAGVALLIAVLTAGLTALVTGFVTLRYQRSLETRKRLEELRAKAYVDFVAAMMELGRRASPG